MNKQSGFNAEQIDKDKYPESKNRLKIKSKIASYHNKTKTRLINKSTSNNKRRLHISQSFPLSSKTYAWLLVSKLTTHVTSQTLNLEIMFLPKWFFFLMEPMLILQSWGRVS
jgi:hypothetical protein